MGPKPPPTPPPEQSATIPQIKARAISDAKIAMLSRPPAIDRNALIIDPAVNTGGSGAINT